MDYLSSRADENVPQPRVRVKNSPQEQNYLKPTFASLTCAAHRPGANSRVDEARGRHKRSNVISSSSPVSSSVLSSTKSRSVQREPSSHVPKRRSRSHSQNQRRVTRLKEVEGNHERLHVISQKQHRPFLLSTVVPQISYSPTIHLDPFTSTYEATGRAYNHRKWEDILKSPERSSSQSYEKFGYVMSSSTFDEGVLLSESLNGRNKEHHEEYLEMLMSVDRGSEVRNLKSASAFASVSSDKDSFPGKEHSSRFSSIGNDESVKERSGSVSRNQIPSYDRREYAEQTHSSSSGLLESKEHSTPKSYTAEKNGFTPETVNAIAKSNKRLITPKMLNMEFYTPHTQWSESVILNETDSRFYGNGMTKTLEFTPNTRQQDSNTINENGRKDGNICDISEIKEEHSFLEEQMKKIQNSKISSSEISQEKSKISPKVYYSEYSPSLLGGKNIPALFEKSNLENENIEIASGIELNEKNCTQLIRDVKVYNRGRNQAEEEENTNAEMTVEKNENKEMKANNENDSHTCLSSDRSSITRFSSPLLVPLKTVLLPYIGTYEHTHILTTGPAGPELIGSGLVGSGQIVLLYFVSKNAQ